MIELTAAGRTRAMQLARNQIKENIRREGFKANQFTAAEIAQWAKAYVEKHPELIERAMADARAMILSGALGKRAAKALRAKLNNDAQSKIEPISTTSAVHMSGAK